MTTTEKAILAGGCFWGVEELLRTYKGVISTEVGYCGGSEQEAKYEFVKTGKTTHAEAILIEFDPQLLSFNELLQAFFKLHDPTTRNQQGNDIGQQYRSAIFFFDDRQKAIAEEIKIEVENSGKWKRPIVTEIVPAMPFYSAEAYHQDYLQKHPDGYTCHYWR